MDLISRVKGISSEKDVDSVVTQCNDVFLQYAGVKSDNKILGHTDYDFPWQEYADIYRQHEVDALAGNAYSTIIPLKDFNGDDLLFLHIKAPKVDKNNNITGIICHAVEIISPDVSQLIKTLCQSVQIKKPVFTLGKTTGINLSYRQSEVLFYLARGKSAKIIAKIMGVSVRTVEYHIEVVKEKIGCRCKGELIEFAIEHGYMQAIPFHDNAKELVDKL